MLLLLLPLLLRLRPLLLLPLGRTSSREVTAVADIVVTLEDPAFGFSRRSVSVRHIRASQG